MLTVRNAPGVAFALGQLLHLLDALRLAWGGLLSLEGVQQLHHSTSNKAV